MADDKKIIRDEIYNSSPSTAFIGKDGNYQHCPTNQLLAEQQAQGLTGAQPIGTHVHPISHAGYCALHLKLGCEAVECNQ